MWWRQIRGREKNKYLSLRRKSHQTFSPPSQRSISYQLKQICFSKGNKSKLLFNQWRIWDADKETGFLEREISFDCVTISSVCNVSELMAEQCRQYRPECRQCTFLLLHQNWWHRPPFECIQAKYFQNLASLQAHHSYNSGNNTCMKIYQTCKTGHILNLYVCWLCVFCIQCS